MKTIKINNLETNKLLLGSEIQYSDTVTIELPKEYDAWKILFILNWKERVDNFVIKVEYLNNENEIVIREFEKGFTNVMFVKSDVEGFYVKTIKISSTIKTQSEFEIKFKEFENKVEYYECSNIEFDDKKEIIQAIKNI